MSAYRLKCLIIESDRELKDLLKNLDKNLQTSQTLDLDVNLTENDLQDYEKSLLADEQLFDGVLDDSMKFEEISIEMKLQECFPDHLEFHEKHPDQTKIMSKQKSTKSDKSGSLKCTNSNCSRVFASKEKLKAHTDQIVMGMCKKMPTYEDRKCYICLRKFSTISQKITHLDQEHKHLTKKCEKCNFQARAIRPFENHLRQHVLGVDYSCEICQKVLRRRSDLQMHFKQQHTTSSIETQRFQCDLCSAFLSQRIHLLRHMKTIHLNQRKFKCHICKETRDFTTQGALRQHQINSHGLQTPYRCLDCKQGFAFNSQLVNHNKRKKVGEPCEKKFSKHTKGKKILYCEICDKFFQTYVGLNRHKSSYHDNIKPFSCEVSTELIFIVRDFLMSHFSNFRFASRVSDKSQFLTFIGRFCLQIF